MDETARRAVAHIQGFVRQAEAIGLRKIEITLSPWYYEQCLVLKGLPHGLGELGSWGPKLQARPISEWRGHGTMYGLNFQAHGLSIITGYEGAERREIKIVGT